MDLEAVEMKVVVSSRVFQPFEVNVNFEISIGW